MSKVNQTDVDNILAMTAGKKLEDIGSASLMLMFRYYKEMENPLLQEKVDAIRMVLDIRGISL